MPIRFLTAGESHGPAMTAILEGIPAGIALCAEDINIDLARRQITLGAGGRMRIEQDSVEILSGVMAGKTTGAPLTLMVINRDHGKWQGKDVAAYTTPRPGHADLNGVLKYGYNDIRPVLERASARETVSRVAIGAVCRKFLAELGVQIGGYVIAIGTASANLENMTLTERLTRARADDTQCPDPVAAEAIRAQIAAIMQARDTLGGIIEVAALGLPVGLGSHVQADRRLDARIAAAIMSVQAIKGVEIGDAFENSHLPGTRAHDPIYREGDNLVRTTNRAGGLEGGMTNGMPLLLRAAMKPIATTLTPQPTVDLASGLPTQTDYERSDFCPVPRAVVILEAVLAVVLADAMLEKLGGDSLDEIRPRLAQLRQARLTDAQLDGRPQRWWEKADD
ncbi:MAG: chorismate synthase [Chloroflexi bacterium HGW-Chloroflexi-10]|nr:MAG: chorismate synthase [Chloroflexi bacterium HGW-Chloroflexi-10]